MLPPDSNSPATEPPRPPLPPPPFRFWRIALAVVIAWGAIGGYVSVVRPLQHQIQFRSEVRTIGHLYLEFQRQLGRSPMDLDELLVYREIVTTPELAQRLPASNFEWTLRASSLALDGPIDVALEAIRDGRFVVVWNADALSPQVSPYMYFAFESSAQNSVGLVIMNQGSVERVEKLQFLAMSQVPSVLPPAPELRLKFPGRPANPSPGPR